MLFFLGVCFGFSQLQMDEWAWECVQVQAVVGELSTFQSCASVCGFTSQFNCLIHLSDIKWKGSFW